MTSTDPFHFPRPFQSFEHPTSTIRVIAFLEGAKPDSGGAASNGLRLYTTNLPVASEKRESQRALQSVRAQFSCLGALC